MGSNQFSGVIPSNLETLQDVVMMYLHDSNLGGTTPSCLGNLTKLIELFLGGTTFMGKFLHIYQTANLLIYLIYLVAIKVV